MPSRRMERLNEQLKREIASRLRTELRDPRLQGIAVTRVRVDPDLTLARVFVRVLGSAEERTEALAGLRAATPWLRGALGRALRIRRTPELDFKLDESLEHAARIDELLEEVRPPEGWSAPDAEGEEGEAGGEGDETNGTDMPGEPEEVGELRGPEST